MTTNLPINSENRAGWRYFHCPDCEHYWKAATRDWQTPSGENCPRCEGWAAPFLSEADPTLQTDAWGNLMLPAPPMRTLKRLR